MKLIESPLDLEINNQQPLALTLIDTVEIDKLITRMARYQKDMQTKIRLNGGKFGDKRAI